ncbi:Vegetative incompatibility protein HET-E-1 [Apiospora arundinis]
MRLINTKTFLLESIYTQVPYAILSHTWGLEEISFQEWEVVHDSGAIQGQCPHTQKMSRPNVIRKKGYEKVAGACQQAARDGIKYLWCDTNCIDKTSSAELSEAINSMFAWYRDSKVCYVILTDVQVPTATSLCGYRSYTEGWFTRQQKSKRQNIDIWERFQKSRWWSRGWTLQELLAPKDLVFFSSDWSPLGNKTNLSEWILGFTTIHRKALHDASSIPTFSIAQRMSWAAGRQTTVPEDMAYCLLGIFDINMPMLYGQGHKAFLKLQEEIIRVSDDHSILAWDKTDSNLEPTAGLANSPAAFKACGDVTRCENLKQSAYTITNLGISMQLQLIRTTTPNVVFAGLNCCRALYHPQDKEVAPSPRGRKEFRIWIPLLLLGYKGDNRWMRVHTPFAKNCLETQFQMMGNTILRDVFILTESKSIPAITNGGALQPPHLWNSLNSSGFLVTIGFGNIDHIQSYTEVWDIRNFAMITLRRRRPHDFSHQLVSSGVFSVLCSAIWDSNGNHVTFRHTVIRQTASEFLAKIECKEKWAVLLDQVPNPSQTLDKMCTMLSALHEHVSTGFVPERKSPEEQMRPLVHASKCTFQDSCGRPTIVVKVIFRDPTSSGY